MDGDGYVRGEGPFIRAAVPDGWSIHGTGCALRIADSRKPVQGA